MAIALDRTRTLRGALSGACAAAVWALQQPLDKAVSGTRYDDVELLGRLFTGSERWLVPGLLTHLGNGATFGAVYANLAPSLPLPAPLRAPALAMAENFGLWPLVALTDRLHPRRDRLPRLGGDRTALAVATWRHLLFGVILGELERRLNAEPEPSPPVPPDYSSNGHGPAQHAISATTVITAGEQPGD